MAKRFPKTLYVTRETPDRDNEFFVANEDRDALSEKGVRLRVAVYEIVEVQELETVTVCRGTTKS